MRPVRIAFAPITDSEGLVTSAILNAGDITLDGVLVTNGVGVITTLPYQQPVTLFASGNESGLSYTITGTNGAGQSVTEVVSGPNATTVLTDTHFETVTSIVQSGGNSSTAVSIGASASGADTAPIPINWRDMASFQLGVYTYVSAGASLGYSVQITSNDVQDKAHTAITWTDLPAFASKTATVASEVTFPGTALRVFMNSHTSGSIEFELISSGGG